jgi:hypothetical protein
MKSVVDVKNTWYPILAVAAVYMVDTRLRLDNSRLLSWREDLMVAVRLRPGYSRKASWAYYGNTHGDMSYMFLNLDGY